MISNYSARKVTAVNNHCHVKEMKKGVKRWRFVLMCTIVTKLWIVGILLESDPVNGRRPVIFLRYQSLL